MKIADLINKDRDHVIKTIEQHFGKKIFPIEKKWVISGGSENNWIQASHAIEPELEPSDPLSLIEILEALAPKITFLQFKKIESFGIWRVDFLSGEHNSIVARKRLNVCKLITAIEKYCE